jgi:hypothetical protein
VIAAGAGADPLAMSLPKKFVTAAISKTIPRGLPADTV